jgi:ribulose kinase
LSAGEVVILGGATLAAVGAGLLPGIPEAAAAMVHETDTIEPDGAHHEQYHFHVDAYAGTYLAMRDLSHRVTQKVGD